MYRMQACQMQIKATYVLTYFKSGCRLLLDFILVWSCLCFSLALYGIYVW